MTAFAATDEPLEVAVLDDHPVVRQSLTRQLTDAGMRVRATGSVREFFASLKASHSAVAIVDLTLEAEASAEVGPDGMEVLAQLAREYPATRCIVFSADSRAQTQERCSQIGAWSYLTKLRADSVEVLLAVQRVAAGERYVARPVDEARPRAFAFANESVLRAVSPRELQVLGYISVGADNDVIATAMGITERTVRAHVGALYAKLQAENRTQLALLAKRVGVRPPAS